MRTKIAILALGLGAGVAAALLWPRDEASSSVGLFDYTNPETVRLGADLYDVNCAACHGADLQGQDDWRTPAANGRAAAPPHDETGHTWHHPDTQLFQIVKFGTEPLVGNGYESDMSGYDGVLSDDEILSVMAYIKSTWPDEVIQRHNEINAAAR